MDLIETSGYTLSDDNVEDFLREFVVLNEGIRSIKQDPRGRTVVIPQGHLVKAEKACCPKAGGQYNRCRGKRDLTHGVGRGEGLHHKG